VTAASEFHRGGRERSEVYSIFVISDFGVILALQRTTHRTLHALATALAGLNLSAAEINVLANLADGRARSVGQLSAETGTKATTLTGVLDRLERHGYLVRQTDPADRRSFRLTLTEAGESASAEVRAAVADLERTALTTLSPDQVAGFHAVVTALQEAC
jgi:MarR family transcriptional regulator, organic hydroperoxide resistance regulator